MGRIKFIINNGGQSYCYAHNYGYIYLNGNQWHSKFWLQYKLYIYGNGKPYANGGAHEQRANM